MTRAVPGFFNRIPLHHSRKVRTYGRELFDLPSQVLKCRHFMNSPLNYGPLTRSNLTQLTDIRSTHIVRVLPGYVQIFSNELHTRTEINPGRIVDGFPRTFSSLNEIGNQEGT